MSASSPTVSGVWSTFPGDKPDNVTFGLTSRALGSMKEPGARERALAGAGLAGRPAFTLKQVHGTLVVEARGAQTPEADGLVTDSRGTVLCAYAADCLPIFMWDKSGKAAGVFHAGWRGIQKGMPREAAAAFLRLCGIQPRQLQAVIGPHIGVCCYKVGPEMKSLFKSVGVGLHLDLAEEAAAQLREAGVERIHASKDCTSCGSDWFSYRRDKTDARMMAFISLDP